MAAPQAWRSDGDLNIGVIVTAAGRTIIDPTAVDGGDAVQVENISTTPSALAAMRPASKQEQVIDLLKRNGGATLTDIVEATGWLPHSSRAVLTGLRKKGHAISSDKIEGVTRYQITAVA